MFKNGISLNLMEKPTVAWVRFTNSLMKLGFAFDFHLASHLGLNLFHSGFALGRL